MARILSCAGLLLALAFLVRTAAADDKNPPGDKKDATAKLVAAGEVTGKLVNVEAAKKTFTLQLTVSYAVPNPSAILNLANLQRQLATTRDRNTLISLQRQILQAQMQLQTVKKESHNLDIEASDDIKVRMKDPPIQFDEKGKPKKYTKKELDELKGDPKLPGYAGDFDSLRPEQIVTVRLSKMKETPRARGGKDKDNDKDLLSDNKPVATMIMILAEPKTD